MTLISATAKKIGAAILAVAICGTAHAQFTTIAYDGFSYSGGSLAGQNGGTGWSGKWTNDYSVGASFNVVTNGMTYSGLTSAGGNLVWASGGNGISEDSRSLSLQNNGIVYIQFLGQFGSTSGGGTPNIRLLDSGALTGGFGGNGGTFGTVMSILDATLNPAVDGSSSSTSSLAALNLVVARIDYQADITEMWMNPNLSTFDYQNPTTPDATYAGLAPVFNDIAIYSRSPANVDELTVMWEAPEPASVFISGAGAILFVWMRRMRF